MEVRQEAGDTTTENIYKMDTCKGVTTVEFLNITKDRILDLGKDLK